MKLRAERQGAMILVTLRDASNNVAGVPFSSKFQSAPKCYTECGRHFSLPSDVIADLILNKLGTGNGPIDIPAAPKAVDMTFRVRPERGKKEDAPKFAEFKDAVEASQHVEDCFIEWEGTSEVCGLDVDFREGMAPQPHLLLNECETMLPAPFMFWLSKHYGLRLMHKRSGIFEADEIAAVAAYQLATVFPMAKFEFLPRTRRPIHGYHSRAHDPNIEGARRLLNEHVEGTDYTEWLTEKSYEMGRRYGHDRCPVNPSNAAAENPPVQVLADGIHCHYCFGKGHKFGSYKPGFFPYSALTGSRVASQIASCVRNFVHWAQARYVVGRIIPQEPTAKRVYSALLKLVHQLDPRIPAVFAACEPMGLLRGDGFWTTHTGELFKVSRDSATLRALPVAIALDADRKPVSRTDVVEQLSQPIDLSPLGYYALMPVRGIQISQFQDVPKSKLYATVQIPALQGDEQQSRVPVYMPGVTARQMVGAFKVLRKILPGLDRKLVMCLIAGRGCTEHRSGLPPMMMVCGPTGAGKTGHIQVAAAICGDTAQVVPYNKDQTRLRQGLMSAKTEGSFVVFDEYFKNARQQGDTDENAMQALLSFDPNSRSHVLYIGPVRLGTLPFMLWADSSIPPEVMRHEQIGRRVFFHRLPGSVQWEPTLQAAGIGEPGFLRTTGKAEVVEACNIILSYVIDRWFTRAATDFAEVAKELGFRLIRDGGAVEEKVQQVQALFDLVCSYPPIQEGTQNKKYFSKPGYKLAQKTGSCPLYDALVELWAPDEQGTRSLRAVSEMDIAGHLGLRKPCKVELLDKNKSKVAIRFVSLDGELINEGLRPCNESTSGASSTSAATGSDSPGNSNMSLELPAFNNPLPQ